MVSRVLFCRGVAFASLLVAACILIEATPLHAADGTWDTTVSDYRWSHAENWQGATIANGAGFAADFNTLDIKADTGVQLDSARTIGHLIFGDTDTESVAGWILGDYGYAQNVLTLSGAGSTITVNAMGLGADASIATVLGGSSGMAKSGLGPLRLSVPMTATGQISVDQGILTLGVDHALRVDQVLQVNAGGTLDLIDKVQFVRDLSNSTLIEPIGGVITGVGGSLTANTQNDTTFAGSIAGGVDLIKAGGRTLTLTGSSSMTGSVSVIGGLSSLRERNVSSDRGYGLTLIDDGSLSNVVAITVKNATLDLDNHSGTKDMTNRISDTASITLDNGTIRFVSRINTHSKETLGHVTASGFSSISMLVSGNHNSPGGPHSAELTLAGLTRKKGSVIQFNRASGTTTPLGRAGDNKPRVFLLDTNGLRFVNNVVVGASIYNDNDKYTPVGYVPGLGFGSAVPNQPGFPNNYMAGAHGDNGFTGLNTLELAGPANDFSSGAIQRVKLGGQTVNSLGLQGSGFGAATRPVTFQNTNDTLTIGSGWMAMWFQQTQIGEVTNRGALTSGVGELFLLGGWQGPWGDGGNVNTIHSVITDNGTNKVMFVMNLARHTYLTANNTYSGGTVVNGMLAREAGGLFRNNLYLQGAPGTVVIPNAANPEDGFIIDSTIVTMQVNGGQIGSSNIATVKGSGVLHLAGNNTLAGVVFKSDGGSSTPALNPAGVLTVTGDIESIPENVAVTPIISGGTLNLNGSTSTVSVTALPEGVYATGVGPLKGLTISSSIQNGGLRKTGDGVLNLGGNNTFAGALSIENGVLSVGSVNNANATGPLGNSALPVVLSVNAMPATLAHTGGTASSTKPFTLTTQGTFLIDASGTVLTLNGLIDGAALRKTGAGTLVLGADNSHTGPTRIEGGVLRISSDAKLGALPGSFRVDDITLDHGGALELSADIALDVKRGIVLGSSGVQKITGVGGSVAPFPGGISGSGSVAFNGTPGQLGLGHPNTYTGETRILGAARLVAGGESAFQFSTVTDAPGGSIFAYAGAGTALFGGLSGRFNLPLQTLAGGPDAVALSVGNNNSSTLFAGVLSGIGSLIKIGSGVLTLSGHNSYAGATTVSAGTLLGRTDGSCSNSIVTVADGATNGVRVVSADGTWDCAGLTLSAGTTALDFGFDVPLSTNFAPLQIHGDLTFSGTVDVRVGPPTRIISTGTYPLMAYSGNLVGVPPALPAALPPGMVATLHHDVANQVIRLVVSVGNEVTWDVGDGDWDIQSSTNWSDPSDALLTYFDGEAVRFDDTAAGGASIEVFLDVAVNPLRIQMDNTSKSFTITGSGSIGGGVDTPLTKLGAGSITIGVPMSYAGGTTISGGSVTLIGAGRLPDTGQLVLNGGALDIGSIIDSVGAVTLTSGNITGSGGVLQGTQYTIANAVGTATVSATLGGAGGLNKSGIGTLILSATNTYSGSTTLRDGVVTVSNLADGGSPSGLGSSSSSAGNLLLDDATLRYTGGTASTDRNFVLADGSVNTIDVVTPGIELTLSGAGIATSGALVKTGSGRLILSGDHAYSGSTTISAGTLQCGDGGSSGAPGTGTIINNGALVFDRSDTSYNQAAAIVGSGSVQKRGGGMVTLSGFNAYEGSTIVQAGILKITEPRLPESTDVFVANGAVMQLDFDGINDIDYLYLDGDNQRVGTWGTTGSGADFIDNTHFSDRGVLRVTRMFFREGVMLIVR